MNYRMLGFSRDEDFDDYLIVATHPAPPGTFLVYANKDGSSTRVPVILWGVQQDASPMPITMSGVWDGVSNRNSFVLHPDGSCSAYERSWDSVEAAINEMRALATD
jgi:hypothetical protein